jgi:pilus assembly protein CpaE
VLPLPAVPAALGDVLVEASVAAGAAAPSPSGRVTAVVGAKGGTGTTSTALAIARLSGAALVDMSGSWASLAALLGCRSERSLADLAHVGEGLAAAVASAAVEHPCGLRLVPGPAGPEIAAALPGGFAAALVRDLRAGGPAVVDAGCGAFAASREAAVAADRALVVVTPDAPAAAAVRELVKTLARAGSADGIRVVVNRWSRRSELSLRGIARTVGVPVAAVVRADAEALDALADGRARLDRWPGRRHTVALRELAAEVSA